MSGAQVFGRARQVGPQQQLRIARHQCHGVRGGRGDSEAISQCDRKGCFQSCRLYHPDDSWQLDVEHLPEISQDLVSSGSSVVPLDAVVDLDRVHPTHDRAVAEDGIDAGEGRFLAVEPGEDCP